MGTFQKFCLRWNNHTSNLLGTLGHILTSEQHTDVTLCCQGEVWRLHKLVLCASSSHFENLLGALPPGNSPIVVLDGPHPQDVASLIHFIYHGEVNVDQENLASLLRTAESLKIKGLAEVSSVTSEQKSLSDGDNQRHHSRGRSRPSNCQSAPIYTVGTEYPVGMYGLIPQSISPHNQLPDPLERDPSPLNLSFNGSLKNIHDETPQERQERRNRLDDLLYAATERSKKEERREARREAREAALREAAAIRESSVMITQDQVVIPPASKRARTTESSRTTALPAHPAFHIPLMNLSLPPNASTSVITSQSISSTQTSHLPEAISLAEKAAVGLHTQEVEPEQHNNQDMEAATQKSPVKIEKIEISSDITIMEDVAVISDESDTQSAPETPSDLIVVPVAPVIPPATTTTATQVPSTGALEDINVVSACRAPIILNNTINATAGASVAPLSESNEEKVTPYFHSILQQVAEGTPTGEPASSNSQRVTINMRTFKEEWRRQLLVDYDTRTNMSICMLCFTTFKSYDGPRKNTYVKHAKRFHPSLEEYSEEERDLIISMYEKYHKYDVDMQKEVNKSYRAANAIVALGKKGIKHCDINAEAITVSELTTKVNNEGEAQEENLEVSTESNSLREEEVTCVSGKSRSHTPESDISLETNEKLSESFDAEEMREKFENNNVSPPLATKRSQMNTRAKTAATAATVAV
ncbi:uncharacterized protein [Cherax quadricarinatus]|nr:uncharacterized protein LOC128701759 [Cherax quadricarinatus]XP_053651652.1 uncharacterized protein LOC128701759 [Cherax quadricarinatus]